jgi:hypothetical protein
MEQTVDEGDEGERIGENHKDKHTGQPKPICIGHPRKVKANFSGSFSGLHGR